MISRLMYKPHITCLSKDILVQNGKTLTTDTIINNTLTNGSEVYCIDTSECYLYDEENKTLIKTKVNNDILIDGEITPESVNIINTKVDNFINDVNERIEQADIDKVVELDERLDVVESDITQLSNIANDNILINGNFKNPINQRGFTTKSYTGSSWEYSIDRWQVGILDSAGQSTCTLNNGYISLDSKANDGCVNIFTVLEFPKSYYGKTLTASFKYRIMNGQPISFDVSAYNNLNKNGIFFDYKNSDNKLIADGEWHIYSFTYTVTGQEVEDNFTGILIGTGNIQKKSDSEDYEWIKPTVDAHVDIEWVKLEYGSQVTPFHPRLYAEELALCQRYYEQIYLPNVARMDTGYVFRESYKVFKRIGPTFKYKSIDGTVGKLSYYNTDRWTDIDVLNNGWSNALGYCLQFSGTGIDRDLLINGNIGADAEIY